MTTLELGDIWDQPLYMNSFPHPQHYFAAAGENDDFVITVINFMRNQSFFFSCDLFGFQALRI